MVWGRPVTVWWRIKLISEELDISQFTFYRVAEVTEIPSGDRVFFEISNKPVMLLNIGGKFYAIGDVCTHDDGPLGDGDLDGTEIICPRHGARFDVCTGKATKRPAVAPTPWYPVRIVGTQIEVGFPK
jgi:3-phenylpropionate/trans-cinnamate dioxygenase ferredoxin subunit